MAITTTETMTRATPTKSVLQTKGGIFYKPLHPTFGAEASGVDFRNITPEVVDDIKDGLAEVLPFALPL